jgi:hypothetical protein
MARQELKVTMNNGKEYIVKVTPRVEVNVELHFKIGLPSIQNDPHAEHVYYLGWAAMVVAKMYHSDFDAFLDELDDVDPIVEEEDPSDDGIDNPSIETRPSEQLSS